MAVSSARVAYAMVRHSIAGGGSSKSYQAYSCLALQWIQNSILISNPGQCHFLSTSKHDQTRFKVTVKLVVQSYSAKGHTLP